MATGPWVIELRTRVRTSGVASPPPVAATQRARDRGRSRPTTTLWTAPTATPVTAPSRPPTLPPARTWATHPGSCQASAIQPAPSEAPQKPPANNPAASHHGSGRQRHSTVPAPIPAAYPCSHPDIRLETIMDRTDPRIPAAPRRSDDAGLREIDLERLRDTDGR